MYCGLLHDTIESFSCEIVMFEAEKDSTMALFSFITNASPLTIPLWLFHSLLVKDNVLYCTKTEGFQCLFENAEDTNYFI